MGPIANKFIPLSLTLLGFYFLLGMAGSFFAIPGQAAFLWPAAGVGFAAVLLMGLRGLLVPLLGSFAIRFLYQGEGWLNFPFYALPPLGEAFVGWCVLRWTLGKRVPLLRSKDVGLFFGGAFLGSIIGALLGVGLSLGGGGSLSGGLIWFLGDFAGILVVAPLFLMVFGLPLRRWLSGLRQGVIPIFLVVGGIQIMGYTFEGVQGLFPFSWEFLTLPAVFGAVLLFRLPGVVVANLCLYSGAILHFSFGGLVQEGDPHFSLPQVQAFLVLVAGMSLALNGFLQEQSLLHKAVEHSEKKLRATLKRLDQELDRQVSLLKERMHLKDELLKSKRAEAIGKRAGSVIHDYSNMMAALIAHVEQAKRFVGRGENPENAFHVLSKGLYHAEILGRRILVDSEEDLIQVSSIQVAEIVEDVFKLWKVVLPSGVQADLVVPKGLPPAPGDPVWLRQAVLNLLRNAKEAVGPKGRVHVEVFEWEEPIFEGDGCWSFGESSHYLGVLVQDDGCGMDESLREKVLEPFFSTKGEGHGFGLSSVIQGLEHLKGALKIESSPGKGTRVQFFLPLDQDLDLIPSVPPIPKGDVTFRRKHRILVIEDDPAIRKLFQRVLEEAGCELRLAGNWKEGKDLLNNSNEAVSLVLLDWSLPDVLGSEALAQIRKGNRELPILLVSGFRENELAALLAEVRQGEGGPVEFMAKPFRPGQLLQLVAELLEEKDEVKENSSSHELKRSER